MEKRGGEDTHKKTPPKPTTHSSNNADLIRALAAAVSKSDLRDRNKRGLTPLAEAVLAGARDAAAALVAAGASLADAQCRGWPLLSVSAAAGNADAVKWVLAARGDACAPGRGGVTPLHAAASAACAPAIHALLQAGAEVDAVDDDGRAPVDVLQQGASGELTTALARTTTTTKTPPPASVTAGAFSSAASAFAALSPADRVATAARWAALDDDEALEAATAPYPTAAFTHASHARTARHRLTIHKAVCMLHDDDDWQEGAAVGRVKAAVDAVRRDPDAVERFLHDPTTMHVLAGLKKLQAVAAVNGRHAVPFDALLTSNCAERDWRSVDARTLAMLRSLHDAHVAAAAAAAAEEEEGEATQAAKRVMDAYEKKSEGDVEAATDNDPTSSTLTSKQRVVDTLVRAALQGLVVAAAVWLINRATAPNKAAVKLSDEL